MFESLTEKLELTFKRLRGEGKISEKNIDDALREVRLALLEADEHDNNWRRGFEVEFTMLATQEFG